MDHTMAAFTQPMQRRLRLLLAVLLLAVQGVAMAHELGHFSAGDTQGCAICSVASQPGATAPEHSPPPATHGRALCDSTITSALLPSSLHHPGAARAPPIIQ